MNGYLNLLFLVCIVGYVILCPFTKVEESFNLQAIHDIIYLGTDLDKYDHQEFPGVVPRTFLGAIAVSFFSTPFVVFAEYFWNATKLVTLYLVRIVLGLICGTCYLRLTNSIEKRFGLGVANSFLVVTLSQFHLPYYLSRSLPNTLALPLFLLAQAFWIEQTTPGLAVFLLVFATTVFRCDILLFLAPFVLHVLVTRQITFGRIVMSSILSGIISLLLTIIVDSYFWGRWLWPEGEVLYFNTILNKSQEWGVMSFHWYFSNALPRALQCNLFLAVLGCAYERRIRGYVFVILVWLFLYSFLGHKELRFIFGALPIFNLAAAVGLNRLWMGSRKSFIQFLRFLVGASMVVITLCGTIFITMISIHNYPGGYALQRLHTIEGLNRYTLRSFNSSDYDPKSVHISVFPAMTGVSKFGYQDHAGWRYSKLEQVAEAQFQYMGFDYLLTDQQFVDGYELVRGVKGYAGLEVQPFKQWINRLLQLKIPFVDFKLEDHVYILKTNSQFKDIVQ